MFKRVLIANRGEIAIRIARTLQEMGITAVACYADSDEDACHVAAADEAYRLAGSGPAETYLNISALVRLAVDHGIDAVHPGYGFLAENAEFAEACAEADVTFIGPSPAVISSMGDKIVAKDTVAEAGVPVVPGYCGTTDDFAALAAAADDIGYPVLVKAAAGGGGKGMRVVPAADDLAEAMAAARREAQAAFGDGRVFLEKYITCPRHVEVQILGDAHGHVLHFYERECSIQRRHQKIIEESPAPGLDNAGRARITAAAVEAARAMDYTGAGTVEFIVDETGSFYFLEVNTRLQVEHPVTELTCGIDLVRLQLEVAAGHPLALEQDDIRPRGWAMECRICAEDAAHNFVPSIGRIEHYLSPTGPGVRVDSGVDRGSAITVHYDSMLAKLIVWAPTRNQAAQRMARALREFVIVGVKTNLEFLQNIVAHEAFRAGNLHTHFLEEHTIAAQVDRLPPHLAEAIAAMAARGTAQPAATISHPDPWATAGHWRGGHG